MHFMHCIRANRGAFAPALVMAALFSGAPALAQDSGSPNEMTTTGTVVSSSRTTLVVRTAAGRHELFVYDRDTTKPASIPAGSEVRVTSSAGDEPGVRIATQVSVTQSPTTTTGAASPATSPAVPPEVRRVERQIQRQSRRFQTGVRAGVALDPELVMIGVHSQVGPFFNPDIYFRPNVNFEFGEVTSLFSVNLEGIYRLPITARTGRWSTYFGLGPGFNFIHQNFVRGGSRIDFGEFSSDVGLNILGGIRFRSGTFVELKTSVYSDPAPTFRMIVGYNF
jgi:hypothetical protein